MPDSKPAKKPDIDTAQHDGHRDRLRGRFVRSGSGAFEDYELLELALFSAIPRKDVKMDRLVRTAHSTHCPFKGDAAYFSLRDGPENAVWSYEQPYDEVNVIKERLAFYPDKVEIAVQKKNNK